MRGYSVQVRGKTTVDLMLSDCIYYGAARGDSGQYLVATLDC